MMKVKVSISRLPAQREERVIEADSTMAALLEALGRDDVQHRSTKGIAPHTGLVISALRVPEKGGDA